MSLSSVPITLDRDRTLVLGIREFREIEQRLGGKPLLEVLGMLTGRGLRLEILIRVLWVALKREDPKLTEARVEDLVQETWLDAGHTIGELCDLLGEALQASGVIPRLVPPPAEDGTTGNGSRPSPSGSLAPSPLPTDA